MRTCFGAWLVAGLMLSTPAIAVPVQWSANDHYYEYVTRPGGYTWTEAEADARGRTYNGLKGHLVTITSAEEEAFLYANITGDLLYGDPWIGAFREAGSDPTTGWQWVTGETWSYTNWRSGEPNNKLPSDSELYVHYLSTGIGGDNQSSGWNDIANSNVRGYLIEYEAVPEPAALGLLGLGLLGLAGRRRKQR